MREWRRRYIATGQLIRATSSARHLLVFSGTVVGDLRHLEAGYKPVVIHPPFFLLRPDLDKLRWAPNRVLSKKESPRSRGRSNTSVFFWQHIRASDFINRQMVPIL